MDRVRAYVTSTGARLMLTECQPGAKFSQQVYARKLAEEENKFECWTNPTLS